ncbi:MAG: TauD/TfdA family dioxygenase [Pseudomonadota bacterium]
MIYDRPISDASAWKADEMADPEAWTHLLSADEIEELDGALRWVRERGLAMAEVTRADFPLPTLEPYLRRLEETVRAGRGFALIRGIPVDRYPDEDVFLMKWGIGTHLGEKVSQNSYGDLLGHVYDHGRDPGSTRTRGYQTRDELRFHVDRADMTSLLCLRKGRSGGLSRVVSSMSVHNEILARRPDCLPPLYEGVPYIHIEEAGEMRGWKEPVFSVTDGVLSCSIRRNTVQKAIERTGIEMTPLETEALAVFDSVAEDPAFVLEMELEPGDIQFVNNYTILHGRSAFTDDPTPGQNRHLVRLWLRFFTPRPTADFIRAQYNGIEKELDRAVP